MLTLQEAVDLSERLVLDHDDRPKWLRLLRDAEHPDCIYYRFLYELAARINPVNVIEVGTYVGTSAAHLAAANSGHVTTIDINPDAKLHADRIGIANLTAVTAESQAWAANQHRAPLFGLAYIDGLHNFSQTYSEYTLYRNLVIDGGLLLFDDVGLGMSGDEMEVFWTLVPEQKARVDHLHSTGFGIVQKDNQVRVPSLQEISPQASEIIASRR